MTDTALGYLLLGAGILFLLALVFALSSRSAPPEGVRRAAPPVGVHLPPPSWLPIILAVGGALLGAALVFDVAFVWLLVPGVLVFLAGSVGWFRASGREWREASRHDPHDERTAHR